MTVRNGVCRTCGQAIPNVENDVRAAIRDALEASGLTQAQLAHRIHLSPATVSQVLTGRTRLSFDLADRMLAALGRRLRLEVETR